MINTSYKKFENDFNIISTICSREMIKNDPNNFELIDTITRYISPVLYFYVFWVLEAAIKKNIKCLYFLARDGYEMINIAEIIIKKLNLDIECKYLYCSRNAWRLPSYHILGEEAIDQIFIRGYKTTPITILTRIIVEESELEEIFSELKLDKSFLEKNLSNKELNEFKTKIKKCNKFWEILKHKSEQSYYLTIKYLEQEGCFKYENIGIVDSGWTGSMQKSLSMLLKSKNKNINIFGFYFGLYEKPKEIKYGEYNAWYFNKSKPLYRSLFFNNNLFEAICSVSEGMTISYFEKGEKIVPILKNDNNTHSNWGKEIVTKTSKSFAEVATEYFKDKKLINSYALIIASKKFVKLMAFPTMNIINFLGKIKFCDDVSESYFYNLAHNLSKEELKSVIVINKIINKICGNKRKLIIKTFWFEASLNVTKVKFKNWYKLNYYVINLIWLIRNSIK